MSPYISPKRRTHLLDHYPEDVGELTYEVTVAVDRYLDRRPLSYAHIAEAVAALECAKLELYRRVASPYEDDKRAINGDVYRSLEGL
jgi:hypothetical protein